MKKKLIVILTLFLSFLPLYAEINSVTVITSSKNVNDGEKQWLLDLVRDKFISNFQTYSDFQFVSSNTNKIKQLQRESEKAAYDSDSMIEIGKLTTASHAFFLDVTKTGKNYLISVQFADLTTGKNIAQAISSSRDKTEDLYNTDGCAINELTIDLCNKLDIPLTKVQERLLMEGNLDFSDAEKSESYNQEIKDYNNLISNLNKELEKIELSSDVDAVATEKKLKAQMALAEEKKKQAEEQKIRFLEIQKAKEAEFEANAKRSEEQINKINELSKNANIKIKELRQLKKESENALGFLNQIESKKAAVVQIDENVSLEKSEIAKKIEKDYKLKIDELNATPWRRTETFSDGKPTPEATQKRNEKINELKIECSTIINEQSKKLDQSVKNSKDEIIKDIHSDLKEIKDKTYYANSLDGTLQVSVSNYDGQQKGWKIFYTILCDGVALARESTYLKYSDVEKLVPSGLIYEDAVDMYDSLFKCNEPFLVYGVSYTIEQDASKISTYNFSISELKVYSVSEVNIKKNSALSGKNILVGSKKVVSKQMAKKYDYDAKSRAAAETKNFVFKDTNSIVGLGASYSAFFDSQYNGEDNKNISIYGFLNLGDFILTFSEKSNRSIIIDLGLGWSPLHSNLFLFSINGNIGCEIIDNPLEETDYSLCFGGSSLFVFRLSKELGITGNINCMYHTSDSSFRCMYGVGAVLTIDFQDYLIKKILK